MDLSAFVVEFSAEADDAFFAEERAVLLVWLREHDGRDAAGGVFDFKGGHVFAGFGHDAAKFADGADDLDFFVELFWSEVADEAGFARDVLAEALERMAADVEAEEFFFGFEAFEFGGGFEWFEVEG